MSTAQIPEPIASFLSAVNAGDNDAFIRAFTETAFVDDWGTKYEGLTAIQTWSDRELLGAHGTFTPERVDQHDGAITVVGDWRSSFANGPSSFRFAVEGDQITSMTIREGE